MKKIHYPGIVTDDSKKFKEGEVSYNYASDDEVCGFGRYVSKDVALTVIHEHRNQLKQGEDKQPYAVTFGKEALLSILAQKGCEGIRFYFGKRTKEMWEKPNPYSDRVGLTLVAIGVDDKNKDLGTNGGYIIDKKSSELKSATIVTDDPFDSRIVEIVPPEP